MTKTDIHIIEKGIGERLDIFLHNHFGGEVTRSNINNQIKSGEILLGSTKVKSGTILKSGDIISIIEKEVINDTRAEDIPLDIVFEDAHLMIVKKPRGMIVHPGAGVKTGTLLNALLFHQKDKSLERGGIVHRLDKNTAGIMIVAKTTKSQSLLGKMMESREVSRRYIGIVEGKLEGGGTIMTNIDRDPKNRTIYKAVQHGGRNAITHYESTGVYKFGSKFISIAKFKLETGRTHQIRVHLKSIGHPLVGDPEYNQASSIKFSGQLLESVSLEFIHPITKENMKFEIEPSTDFKQIEKKLIKIS